MVNQLECQTHVQTGTSWLLFLRYRADEEKDYLLLNL